MPKNNHVSATLYLDCYTNWSGITRWLWELRSENGIYVSGGEIQTYSTKASAKRRASQVAGILGILIDCVCVTILGE